MLQIVRYNALVILKVSLNRLKMLSLKMMNIIKVSSQIMIFYISFIFFATAAASTGTGILTLETEFCLVNSTPGQIIISNTSSIDEADWTGSFRPVNLLNQMIMPYSSSCWPLTIARRIGGKYQFNIDIKTDSGAVSWVVRQYDAVGEIHAKYDTLTNTTNYYLIQKAGDNNGYATNVFILENNGKMQEEYLSNWMGRIPGHFTLKQIQLIGAHDAGVNSQDDTSCNITPALAVAQKWSLATQLSHGVRFFDIRLEKGSDNLHYPYHRTSYFGCTSKKSFEQSLNEIISFIKSHRGETVFLKISHTSAPVESVMKMLDNWTQSADTGEYFFTSGIDKYNWVDQTIAELRGKIIILLDCEYANFLNPGNGYFSYFTEKKETCSPDDEAKIIYDQYSNTLDFNKMYTDQLLKLQEHGNNKKQLFLLSWTMSGGDIVAHTPRPAAVLASLSYKKFGKQLPLPNIVYYDFEDPGINMVLVSNYEATATGI